MLQVPKAPAVNYIRHIDIFFEIVRMSPAINYGHIAMYISMFRAYNHSFFSNPMSPGRDELMAYAGIRSKECYYRLIREISDLDLIRYYPSRSKYEAGLFCMSSLEWVDTGIKIIVWAISNHQTIDGKQLDIPNTTSTPIGNSTKLHKSQLLNGRGSLITEKQVILDFNQVVPFTKNDFFDPITDPRYASHIDNDFSSLSNISNHANHQNSKSRRTGLHPSGVPIDPNADYSVRL